MFQMLIWPTYPYRAVSGDLLHVKQNFLDPSTTFSKIFCLSLPRELLEADGVSLSGCRGRVTGRGRSKHAFFKNVARACTFF